MCLRENMQVIIDAISREEWKMVVTIAPLIADHSQPPLAESMCVFQFIGSDADTFKRHDIETAQGGADAEAGDCTSRRASRNRVFRGYCKPAARPAISVPVNRLGSISMNSAEVTRSTVQFLIARQQVRCIGLHLVSVQSQRWAEHSYLILAVGGA